MSRGLRFGVLDRDQSAGEPGLYCQNIAGSRYFMRAAESYSTMPILSAVCASGELSLAIDIPGRVSAAICGAATAPEVGVLDRRRHALSRGNECVATSQGHAPRLRPAASSGEADRRDQQHSPVNIVSRYPLQPGRQEHLRHGTGGHSHPAHAVIPAILMALGVVREKELGSITNLYVTPVTRLEFLLGKQLPYIARRPVWRVSCCSMLEASRRSCSACAAQGQPARLDASAPSFT